MRIRFGLRLDGERGWASANRLGDAVMGPLALLSTLETQLGLLRDWPGSAERILQYRDCLKRCDADDRFFHATFAADDLGAAKTLLDWRDLWHLHGWHGTFSEPAGPRLLDMAAVEVEATGLLAPSIGERLLLVAKAMERRRPGIDEIVLVDPIAAFPGRWREVLAHLPCTDTKYAASAKGSSLLSQIQSALVRAQAGEDVDKIIWKDDGSLTVVRGETRLAAGSWLANRLRHSQSDTVFVAQQDATLLNGTFEAADIASQGFREPSIFRPALQLLPLALDVLWEPLDFYALLKFLTHPVCPIPGHARRRLAAELADRPGMGGENWRDALLRIDEHDGDKAASVREAIHFWVEHPRYEAMKGAPIAVVLDRTQRLADFFRVRLAEPDKAKRMAYMDGHTQASALAKNFETLQSQGLETIRPRQLQTLIAQATASGTSSSFAEAEVGSIAAASDPAAVIESFKRVVWWQMAAPRSPAAYPWSRTEIGTLKAAGTDLPAIAEVLQHGATEWLRPILAAQEELVLVLPPVGEELHPAWLAIAAVTTNVSILAVESILEHGKTGDGRVAVPFQPLQPRKRWWQLPDDVMIEPRASESYSSLDIFINNPYRWVLQYPARLRPSSVLSVSSDFLLFGNLAHRVVESFFREERALSMTDPQLHSWFARVFPKIVSEQGAVLQMRGRAGALEKLRGKLSAALVALRRQLVAASVAQVEPERELAGEFVGGKLGGIADLVVAKVDGTKAIVDMKWSGSGKYAKKLGENRHLQLAVYGELVRKSRGEWPDVAYFVLDQARLISANGNFFPDAQVTPQRGEESTPELWLRFVETWKWRRLQIDARSIEVVIDGIEETGESTAPENGLPIETLDQRYDNFVALTGWED